jgi:hypothetical protein
VQKLTPFVLAGVRFVPLLRKERDGLERSLQLVGVVAPAAGGGGADPRREMFRKLGATIQAIVHVAQKISESFRQRHQIHSCQRRRSVDVSRGGAFICLSVSDTGAGIAAAQLPHVFERYWQKEDRRRGSGLGLYIAKAVVESHGGKVWVEREIDGGSIFSFTVLAASGVPAEPETRPSPLS